MRYFRGVKARTYFYSHMYYSPNIIAVIKSKRMRWTGHVARMVERSIQGFGGKN
jgi:hypothetical protein